MRGLAEMTLTPVPQTQPSPRPRVAAGAGGRRCLPCTGPRPGPCGRGPEEKVRLSHPAGQ